MVRPVEGQIDDLISDESPNLQMNDGKVPRHDADVKRMAEDLTDYMLKRNRRQDAICTRDIDTSGT